jgi:hypothetical protein
MRLLLGLLLVVAVLVYLNNRSDCSFEGMSTKNWLLCVTR